MEQPLSLLNQCYHKETFFNAIFFKGKGVTRFVTSFFIMFSCDITRVLIQIIDLYTSHRDLLLNRLKMSLEVNCIVVVGFQPIPNRINGHIIIFGCLSDGAKDSVFDRNSYSSL